MTAAAIPITVGARPRLYTWMPVIIAAVAMVAFANTLQNGFVLDDEGIIVHNSLVHSISGVWRAFMEPYWPTGAGQYRPLVIASFSAEWTLFRGAPLGFHAVNIAWHALASVLVFALARRWLSFGGASIAALIFAVHPVHVEAVANVVGRAELMAACGVIAMLLLHAKRSPWAVVAFAVALLSKEHAIIAPVAAIAIDLIERRVREKGDVARGERARRAWPLYLAYLISVVAWAGALIAVFHDRAFTNVAPLWSGVDAPTRVLTMLGVVPLWVQLWFVPYTLSADYSPQVVHAWPDNAIAATLGALLLLAAFVAMVWPARRTPALRIATGLMLLAMLPVANLVIPTGIIAAERTLYLSSVGAVILAGLVAERVARDSLGVVVALALAILAAGFARTWTRNAVWESNRSLFIETASQHPEASWTHASIARIYSGNGGHQRALDEYRMSLALFDRNPVTWSEAIFAAANANNGPVADSLVAEASRRFRGLYEIDIAHAFSALRTHKYSEALRAARAASAAMPDSSPPRFFEGVALLELGSVDSARAALLRVGAGHPLKATADSILMEITKRPP